MDDFMNLEAYLSNLGKYTEGRPAGEWVRFPTTAEHLKEVFDRIGIDGKKYESWHITQYNSDFDRLTRNLSEYESLDELNYLGKLLEMQGDGDRDKFAAAVTHGEYAGSVKDLINLAQNLDCYWLYPTVHSEEDYGYYLIDELDAMELPQDAKKYFMYEEYGRDSIINEGGELTDQGYIFNNRNTFTEWYDGRDVPEEYRVTPQLPQPEQENPNIDYDAIATRQPAVATAQPPEQAQPQPVIPLVLQSERPGEKLKEITDRLEQGIKGVFENGQYEAYLKTMSKFHNYSLNNTTLIFMQKPDASHIAGFTSWKNNFERQVRKGEKGIKIIAPSPFKVKEQREKIDPNTQRPVIGRNGKPVTEEVEVKIPAYKVVSVFDVSQTDGKELPTIGVDELTGSVEQYGDFFAALEKASPVPVAFEEIEGGANGYYHLEDKRIAIREGMSELQTLKTAIHEIAHARLHDVDVNAPKDEQPRAPKRSREVEAESIAYTVCQHYGLDTSDYSFGYVAGWSSGKELTELKASLETIRSTAAGLITEIDGHFAELQKDKEQTAEQQPGHEEWSEAATAENAPDSLGVPSDDINAYLPEQGDTYSIYQLKHGDSTRDYRFEPFDRLQSAGLAVDPANYELVYTAPITADTDNLEKIFEKFNIDHPEDFEGHSLSVSDVVTLTRDGVETAHYVDSFGYKEVPEFLQPAQPSPDLQQTQKGTGVKYYPINEQAARRAKEAISFSDYRQGSTTAEYRQYVDEAVKLAERQKARVDPMHHEKIDGLLDTYARKMAENINNGNSITARVPSIMIAGGSNFPVRKKEKQNAASDKNMQEWRDIQGLLDKIRSTGMGGISADDPNAIQKLQSKLAGLEQSQETMKAVNAYYRKHKTLDGCPDLTTEQIARLKADMSRSWRSDPKPFETYALSNNNAEIHRVKARIEDLTRREERSYTGWQFDGGKVEANGQENRLQVFFDDKPDADTRAELKSNGFRWSPNAGAWQRQLTDNAFYAANGIKCIQPITGERPTDLQRKGQEEKAPAPAPTNYLETAEMSTEQNYNMIDGIMNNTPTVAELEAKAKAGEQISLTDLATAIKAEKNAPTRDTGKKPSIREQLKADKQKIAAAPQKAAVKSQNNDLEV